MERDTKLIKDTKIKVMRKYRIYDLEEKEYCEEPDFRWLLSREGKLYNSERDKWYNPGENYIVEFHTGLTDSNGKEIFEGDILYTKYEDKCVEKGYYEVYNEVAFRFGSYGFIGETSGNLFPFSEYIINDEIVIGNIHDNPELLKKGNQ